MCICAFILLQYSIIKGDYFLVLWKVGNLPRKFESRYVLIVLIEMYTNENTHEVHTHAEIRQTCS